MKGISKICIALVLLVGMMFSLSHTYRALVKNCPEDPTVNDWWYSWDLYRMENPNDYLTKDLGGCGTIYNASGQQIRWYADAANFPSGDDWMDGDTMVVLGSWEPNEGTANHAAEYWLYSDMMDADVDPQTWPSDTMRMMEPAVVGASRRTLNVEIMNPYETNRSPWGSEEYDVLGFWVVADTTGSGLVSNYDVDLGFVAVNGGPGGITTYSYDTDVRYYTGFAKSTYHSYYIVARPDTATVTTGVPPGFSTLYMAANSNLYTFGVEESDNAEYVIPLAAAPNPFTQNATISYSLTQSSPVKLTVYNAAGQLIQILLNEAKPAGNHSIQFDGASLPSGVYFYRLETTERSITNTFTKVK